MIKRLKALVNWLESRFPEKVVVSAERYTQFAADVEALADRVITVNSDLLHHGERLSKIEAAAVHKEAVQDLIRVVKALQDDVTSLKTSLGFNKMVQKQDDISAMLNGEVI